MLEVEGGGGGGGGAGSQKAGGGEIFSFQKQGRVLPLLHPSSSTTG